VTLSRGSASSFEKDSCERHENVIISTVLLSIMPSALVGFFPKDFAFADPQHSSLKLSLFVLFANTV
jgi:hypothetical protein